MRSTASSLGAAHVAGCARWLTSWSAEMRDSMNPLPVREWPAIAEHHIDRPAETR